jgi:hypothetical protein
VRSAGAVTAAVSWSSAEDVFLLNQLSRLKTIYHRLSGFKSDFRIFRGGSKWSFSKRCCNSKACLWSHLSSSPIPEAGSDDPNFLLHAFFVIVKLACGLIFLYLPFRSQVDPNTLVVKVVVIVRIACGPHIYLPSRRHGCISVLGGCPAPRRPWLHAFGSFHHMHFGGK